MHLSRSGLRSSWYGKSPNAAGVLELFSSSIFLLFPFANILGIYPWKVFCFFPSFRKSGQRRYYFINFMNIGIIGSCYDMKVY